METVNNAKTWDRRFAEMPDAIQATAGRLHQCESLKAMHAAWKELYPGDFYFFYESCDHSLIGGADYCHKCGESLGSY